MLKQAVITVLFLVFGSVTLFAQTHLTVSTSHGVYKLIESAEVKGLATKLSQVKPYTRRQIIEILGQIDAKRYTLSNREQKVLDYYLNEFASDFKEDGNTALETLIKGRLDLAGLKSTMSVGLSFDSHWQIMAEDPKNFYTRSPIKAYLRGDIYNSLFSYRVDVQLSVDRLRKDPFVIREQWQGAGQGYHMGATLDNSNLGDASTGPLAGGFEMRPELTTSFLDNIFLFRFGLVEGRNVGMGNTGLMLGGYATPYLAFDYAIRPLDFFNFYTLIGSLGYELTDAKNGEDTSGYQRENLQPGEDLRNRFLQNNKFVSYHLFEFFASDFFYFNMWEGMIWSKRFEFGYLNPFGIYMFTQDLLGDQDNAQFGFSGATIAPKYFKLYAEIFVDEFSRKLNHPRAQYAGQYGIRFNVPKLPFTTLNFQYSKIEPYVYTHYPQDSSFIGDSKFHEPVFTDTGMTNQGRSIGSYLKPNSDEFLVRLETIPYPGLTAYLGWQLIRHGSNPQVKVYINNVGNLVPYDPSNPPSQGDFIPLNGGTGAFSDDDWFWSWNPDAINGELNAPVHYLRLEDKTKKFLRDGVYDWTNVVSMGFTYDLRAMKLGSTKTKYAPIIVGFDYQMGYTFFDMNGIKIENGINRIPEGYNGYKPFFKNTFAIKFTIFPGY